MTLACARQEAGRCTEAAAPCANAPTAPTRVLMVAAEVIRPSRRASIFTQAVYAASAPRVAETSVATRAQSAAQLAAYRRPPMTAAMDNGVAPARRAGELRRTSHPYGRANSSA